MSFVIHAGLFAFDIVMNAITRETWEGQTLFSLQATVHYPGKPKGGNERRTLKQKQWRNTAYWLAHWLMLTYRSHLEENDYIFRGKSSGQDMLTIENGYFFWSEKSNRENDIISGSKQMLAYTYS